MRQGAGQYKPFLFSFGEGNGVRESALKEESVIIEPLKQPDPERKSSRSACGKKNPSGEGNPIFS